MHIQLLFPKRFSMFSTSAWEKKRSRRFSTLGLLFLGMVLTGLGPA
jgi:hypothetical protein